MEERQLLIFRCEGKTYGVPVEDVIGIISNAGTNGLAIIANANGVQIMIIVDEVIQEKKLVHNEAVLDATVAVLQIWKFKQEQLISHNNKIKLN